MWTMDRSFGKYNGADGDGLRTGTVLIVTPGGLEHGGGIGRQMGYYLRAYQAGQRRLRYRVVDSRGPWYIGSSPLYRAGSVIYFGYAMLTLLRASLSSPCVAHVN